MFSPIAVNVSSGRADVRFSLVGFGYASAMSPVPSVAPRVLGSQVEYRHGALTEWWANGPLGLEQAFDVPARPAVGSGPLTVALHVSGNLRARLQNGAVAFSGAGRSLRYGGLVATDSRGRVLRSWLSLRSGRLLIRVDDRGAAYPLRIDPFVQQAKLTATDGGTGEQLGESVAVAGDTIVADAPSHGVGGAVYMFSEPASGWGNATQTAELTSSAGAPSSNLGDSVAISGGTIAAGAQYTTVGANGTAGAVYVFTEPASGWTNATQAAELTVAGSPAGYFLGSAVAMSGSAIVAGARGATVDTQSDEGAAYVFTEPASGWANATQTAELTASDAALGDLFGASVGLSGATIAAGAPGARSQPGAAYAFVALPPTVSITAPGNGTTYGQGQTVDASYSCAAPTGATITSCSGPVASGTAVDTAGPGSHSFPVTAADSDGFSASQTVEYTVIAPPANTGLPAIAGATTPGDTLTCSAGSWSNAPTSFGYVWSRNATPIAGATSSTYTLQKIDEGAALTCTVTASNGGTAVSATSTGVKVPVPSVPHCPAATGKLSGTKLGLLALGDTRARAKRIYTHSSDCGQTDKDFFCLTPIGVRVGYASAKLLSTLHARDRNAYRDRVIWISTSNPHYAVSGVRSGTTVAAARKRLKLGSRFVIGLNDWYIAPDGAATAVLKVRHGIVQEIGIGDRALTSGRTAQRTFLTSFS